MGFFASRLTVRCLILSMGLMSAGSASAGTALLFDLGAELGGDRLLTLNYLDGSHYEISAGKGLVLNLGVAVSPFFGEFSEHNFEIQPTVGIKYDAPRPMADQNVNYYRWPLELLGMYRYVPWNFRLGGGLTYNMGNVLKASGTLLSAEYKYKNALGYVIQADWTSSHYVGLALRYTKISYDPDFTGGTRAKADSVGIIVTFRLDLFGTEARDVSESTADRKRFDEYQEYPQQPKLYEAPKEEPYPQAQPPKRKKARARTRTKTPVGVEKGATLRLPASSP